MTMKDAARLIHASRTGMFRLVGEGECIAIQKAWQEDHRGMILLDQMT